MFGARLISARCASVAIGLGAWEAFRSKDEPPLLSPVNRLLLSNTKLASVCVPTDPLLPASPTKRQGWSAGARTIPEHMFEYSTKMPAVGADGDSKKLVADAVKAARTVSDIKYAKIGQCNEDQLYNRRKDHQTYPPHIYDQDRFRVVMYGVLGLPDGREFESVGAKVNNVLQDVRLNDQLEPLQMSNQHCAGTSKRPIAIYMYPVHEKYDGQSEQLSLDVESHLRAMADAKRKEPTDMQQDGEDDETHDQRRKFLKAERIAAARGASAAKSDVPVVRACDVPGYVPKKTIAKPMEMFDGRKNRYLGRWSATPSPFEHRATVEAKYLVDTIMKQLGPDDGATKLNELTAEYKYHSVLTKLNSTSGLSGFPAYTHAREAKPLHQALKNRWLAKPASSETTLTKFFGSGSAST